MKVNSIIVLDIDGVLFSSNYNLYLNSKRKKDRDKDGWIFDPVCVANLNEIIELTGADIVISSTWRTAGTKRLQEMFIRRGIKGTILGCTPIVFEYLNRGEEISYWFEQNGLPEKFAIVDDSEIGGYFTKAFVKTNMKTGLDEEAKQKILTLLK